MPAAIDRQTGEGSCGQIQITGNESVFPQFTQLPPEIRRMIWLAAAQIPRTLEVSQHGRIIDKLRRKYGIFRVFYTKWIGDTTPAILSASQESRSVALERYTQLHFEFYKTTIRTHVTKPKDLYANLNLDVLYLQISPRLTCIQNSWPNTMRPVRATFTNTFAPFRRLRFDTRRAGGSLCDCVRDADQFDDLEPTDFNLQQAYQKVLIKSLLLQAWYFSANVELIELILEENEDAVLGVPLVRDALEELVQGYSLLVDIEFFEVHASSRVDESEALFPAVRLYFPPETRDSMIALSQS